MCRKGKYARSGILVFVLLLLATAVMPESILITAGATTVTYQASEAFYNGLGIQGKDQWYYQQFNGTAYSNLSWDYANTKWYGSQTYLAISGAIQHPEAYYDSVRKWVAPCDGTARIRGNVRKYDINGGDGVLVKILQNGVQFWANQIAYNDNVGLDHDITRAVKAGDSIAFSVNNAGTIYNDSTYWDPCIDFTPAGTGTVIREWGFTSSAEGWTANWHSSVSASGGNLNVTITGDDPSIKSPDNLNIDITKTGILKIRYKNSTNNTIGCIYFTTSEDTTFTQSKAKAFTIIANDPNYTEYTIDMSGTYGWLGKLRQIRFDPSDASSGSCSIDFVSLQAGGQNAPEFSLLDKEIIYNNNTLKNVKDLDYYADSSMGVIRNSDASYDFITSNSGSPSGQNTTITHGTLDDPANTIVSKWLSVQGVPSYYQYTSGGPVYRDPSDPDTWLTFLHLERHFTVGGTPYFDASIGLAVTRNGGAAWTWCGVVIDHDLAYDPTRAMSLDIGGCSYVIYNSGGTDYFYVYTIDMSEGNPGLAALAVSRAPVADVLNAAKNNTVTSWYKYYNGGWSQPAINGSFTNLAPDTTYMGFSSVSYNTYLNKFLLAYTSTRQWGTNNWSDISLILSDSPVDFKNNVKEYLIDASSKYTQYPTIIGLGNSDPQTKTQKNFYIYYMQFENDLIWGSDTNLVRKMVILD